MDLSPAHYRQHKKQKVTRTTHGAAELQQIPVAECLLLCLARMEEHSRDINERASIT